MTNLQERYRKKGIALALGAGVSCRSGIPDWLTLLERVAKKCGGRRLCLPPPAGDQRNAELLEEPGHLFGALEVALLDRLESREL
jgi:hypothetical protein